MFLRRPLRSGDGFKGFLFLDLALPSRFFIGLATKVAFYSPRYDINNCESMANSTFRTIIN
jgi:hypothetical protein